MAFLFLGSHPAMDFLNTRPAPRGEAIELIGDGPSWLAWLEQAGLLDAASAPSIARRFPAASLDAAAADARELREWARTWLARWRETPAGAFKTEIRRLNGLLARASGYRELVRAGNAYQLAERHRVDAAAALVGLVAESIASFIATEDASLVRQCAGPDCTLWFVDRTKAHSRVFCSAAACGNRARVAAFRDRQRRPSGARSRRA